MKTPPPPWHLGEKGSPPHPPGRATCGERTCVTVSSLLSPHRAARCPGMLPRGEGEHTTGRKGRDANHGCRSSWVTP